MTVLSRCLQFNLKQMPAQAISTHLANVIAQENTNGEPAALRLIAAAARGSMRDALSLLDQAIAYSAGQLTEASVRAMLGTVDDTFLFAVLQALRDGNPRGAMTVADDMEARNLSFDDALQDLATLLHRIALAQTVPTTLSAEDPQSEAIAALAASMQPEEVQLYYQIALHGRQDLPLAPDGYAGFTMSLLRMFAFKPEESGGAPGKTATAVGLGTTTSAAPAAPTVHRAFDGDWPALAKILNVTGMARQLAQQSEMKTFAGDSIELCVPIAHKHLADKPYPDKLTAALQEHFRRSIRITVKVGATTGNSAQDQAIASIQQDALVRGLVENFDATIVASSIKPVQ